MSRSNTNPHCPEKTKRPVGRPRKGEVPYAANLQIRVTQEVADACRAMGGADFLRPVIEAAVKSVGHSTNTEKTAAQTAALHVPPLYRPMSTNVTAASLAAGR